MDPSSKRGTLFPGSEGFQLQWDNAPRYSKNLGLPSKVIERADSLDKHDVRIETRFSSPWRRYKRIYDLQLDTLVTMCQKIPATSEIFGIRKITDPMTIQQLQLSNRIENKYFLQCSEIFSMDNSYYVVSEFADISLREVVCCAIYIEESQLASIVFQILNAMVSMLEHDLWLRRLQEADVLLLQTDDVRFDNFLTARPTDGDTYAEICQELGRLMVTLMERIPPDGDNIGLEKPEIWTRQAIDFMAQTTSAIPKELLQHSFLRDAEHPEEVAGLVRFAQTSAMRKYKK